MTSLHPPDDCATDRPRSRAHLLGYPIDRVTMDQAVATCLGYLEGDRRPKLVLTLNAATLAMADRDPSFRDVLRAGDLVLADGVPIVWAARLLGDGLEHRVTGVDLMAELIEQADRDGLRVFFLGARPPWVS